MFNVDPSTPTGRVGGRSTRASTSTAPALTEAERVKKSRATVALGGGVVPALRDEMMRRSREAVANSPVAPSRRIRTPDAPARVGSVGAASASGAVQAAWPGQRVGHELWRQRALEMLCYSGLLCGRYGLIYAIYGIHASWLGGEKKEPTVADGVIRVFDEHLTAPKRDMLSRIIDGEEPSLGHLKEVGMFRRRERDEGALPVWIRRNGGVAYLLVVRVTGIERADGTVGPVREVLGAAGAKMAGWASADSIEWVRRVTDSPEAGKPEMLWVKGGEGLPSRMTDYVRQGYLPGVTKPRSSGINGNLVWGCEMAGFGGLVSQDVYFVSGFPRASPSEQMLVECFLATCVGGGFADPLATALGASRISMNTIPGRCPGLSLGKDVFLGWVG